MSDFKNVSIKQNNLSFLDGIRGWASLGVTIHHFLMAFYPSLFSGDKNSSHFMNYLDASLVNSPVNLIFNGHLFVCIFFVLSGFVLSLKYLKSFDVEIIRSYAIKRYPRLLIPVGFVSIIVFIMIKMSLFKNTEVALLTHSLWFKDFWDFNPSVFGLIQAILFGIFFQINCGFNTVFWTMQIELFGSFLVFSFLILFSAFNRKYFIYLICLIILANLNQVYFFGFIAGVFLCDIYLKLESAQNNILPLVSSLPVLLLGLLLGSFPTGQLSDYGIYSFMVIERIPDHASWYHMTGAILILFSILSNRKLQNSMSNQISVWLGKCSFSLYLIHVPLMGSLISYIFLYFLSYLTYNLCTLFVFVVYLLSAFLVSHYMTKYVDSKSMHFSSFLYKRFFTSVQ